MNKNGESLKNAVLELGTGKISKLLAHYAIPSIIAMTASSLYNMVDSIFIGQGVGNYVLAGLALTFPLMNLGAAFGALVGVGASSLISMLLGQKNYEMGEKVLGNTVTLNLIMGILYGLIVILFMDPILYFFGASENTISYAREYMIIISAGNVISHMYFGLNAVTRATGFPKVAMIATILTVVLNTVLDLLFIFVFKWGIQGAAIATILAQLVSLVWICRSLSDHNKLIHFKRGSYGLKKRIVKDIVAIGMSPFCMNTAACIVVILINQGLHEHGGDMAIGAYGVVNRICFVAIMIVMGINQGMQPIVGYNFGARNFGRVQKTLNITILWATIVTTLSFAAGELFPKQLVEIFTTDPELTEKSVIGMRIVFIFFPIIGFQMVTSNFFQSIGMAGKSIFLSLSRQVLVLIPLLLVLPAFYKEKGIWYSMPISDLVASFIAFFMLSYQMRVFKRKALEDKMHPQSAAIDDIEKNLI